MLTLGSLFDGISGFPLAAQRNGIIPLWASEIEKFTMNVTKEHFPDMVQVGDITKLNGAQLPEVDIVTGGSPCQDLSVAGKRAGLAGKRSGLFAEQIRIIKEMRKKSEQRLRWESGGTVDPVRVRPRYMLWENVPGAFSSAGGNDFLAVLEETCRVSDNSISIPRPDRGRWLSAGCIMGDVFSVCWRVLNSQYWGVPQRRCRIFLVADFGGLSAPKILFEQDCLFGNTQTSQGERQAAAQSTQESIGNTSRTEMICLNDQGGEWFNLSHNVSGTLTAQVSSHAPIVMATQQFNAEIYEDLCSTITSAAGTSGNNQPVLYENHATDSRYTKMTVASTLTSSMETNGNNMSFLTQEKKSKSYCIAANTISRQDRNGGNGTGVQADLAYTLTTSDQHAVFDVSVFGQHQYGSYHEGCATLLASGGSTGGGSENLAVSNNLVRRLTPLECERLQGFPDYWTLINGASDSARYKALGNSVAVPCVEFVMRGIAYFLRLEKEGENTNVHISK